MERVIFKPREGFEKRNADIGFDFGNLDGKGYWNETVGYKFSAKEIDQLEAATSRLFTMTVELMDELVQDTLYMNKLGLNQEMQKFIKNSWDRDNYSLYGRFDFFFDGKEIKLFEYNADTPTSLLESSLIQYYWMKDRGLPDQFNSLHEKLIAEWEFLRTNEVDKRKLYFTCSKGNQEDYRTLEYLMDTASQAGHQPELIFIEDIGCNSKDFFDYSNRKMEAIFKLYPWEWLLAEEFSYAIPRAECFWVEPPWKLLLSNKGLLVKLWEKFPNDELLLPTFFDKPENAETDFVRKPIYSREGANVLLPGHKETGGDYNENPESVVYQKYKPLPKFDDVHPMIGSWIVGDQPAGIGIREDKNLVTGNLSRFTPHWFE